MPKKKTLTEVLESPIGKETLRDIKGLIHEIQLPFFKSDADSARDSYRELLSAQIGAKDLDKVLAELEERGRAIGEVMTEKGIVTPEQLEEVASEQRRKGVSWAKALVNLNLVSPSSIESICQVMNRELEEKASGKALDMLLVSEKLLTKTALQKIKETAKKNKQNLAQAALASRKVALKKLGELYKKHYDIGWIDILSADIDDRAVQMIPDHLMQDEIILAVCTGSNTLRVAMASPRNDNLCDRLQIMTGRTIEPLLADAAAIKTVQRRFLLDIDAPKLPSTQSLQNMDPIDLADSAVAVQRVDQIFEGAINIHATDIHLEPQENHLRIRYRIDGILHDFITLPEEVGISVVSRLKILANMDITERRRPQDGRMKIDIKGNTFNLRAATLPTNMGEKLALRVLDDESLMLGQSELGMEKDEQRKIERALSHNAGMILVTGPIGSGKTTTLYNMLQRKNTESTNIVTIEDPVEYQLPGINQIAVDPKSDLTFATGLRAILRQDADVLMVGEIRDSETAQTAIRAAMTGHLLFSTLHTNDAVGAIAALQHLGVKPFLVSTALVCVISQRLVRRICPHCGTTDTVKAALRKEMGLAANSRKKVPVAVGCDRCFHTGYKGRIGVYDIVMVNSAMRDKIVSGASDSELHTQAAKDGSLGLLAAG
jgi:type II secretory ATPase GspE/PulE/Tfp pilus assembly ATPase PilB-like protein